MFSSRLILNLGLLALLATLITTALISTQPSETVSAFSSLNINEVSSVEIKYNKNTTQLNKQQGTWIINLPLSVEADTFRMQAILNILSLKDPLHYEIEAKDYKKYSLQPALASIKLNQQLFYFGSTSPVNGKRYVLTNQKLFLIDDTYFPLVTSGYKNLMRRQLFHSNTRIHNITIDHKKVFQNGQGSWQSSNKTTSADHLKQFVDNWLHIQAYAVSQATPPYNGTVVIFKTGENKTLKRIIHKTDVNTVVINPELGLSYQFDIKAYESLTSIGYYSKTATADKP